MRKPLTPEQKAAKNAYMKAYNQRPEIKTHRDAYLAEYKTRPEVIERKRKYNRARWGAAKETPEEIARLREKARRYARRLSGATTTSGELPERECDICGTHTKLCFDHCHTTGQHRGWLCRGCNTGLGGFKDDPHRLLRAVSYLHQSFNSRTGPAQ